MATTRIITELVNKFRSTGAGQVISDINKVSDSTKTLGMFQEEVTKKQTRLANQSTNTGREFASQASGLGGLVAAYAGAAATTFALQQAFSALSSAARSEALIVGINSLAQSLGQNGPRIVANIKEITRGQLSIAEAAQNTGIALSAGLSGDQFNQLADIATRASKVLGRDLTDSIQRLTRGVGKLEPELLDELGIFTRIEPAVERYAAKVGKAANSLTNFERRQAFANAVIEEGSIKYQNVDTSIADSAQNINRLSANFVDLATKVGQILTTILNPILEYFNRDIVNLASLLGVIGSLVFAKLNQVSTEALDNLKRRIDTFAAYTTARIAKATGGAAAFGVNVAAAQAAATGFNAVGTPGKGKQREDFREALAVVKSGDIAPSQVAAIKESIDKQLKVEAEYLAKQRLNQEKITKDTSSGKVVAGSSQQLDQYAKNIENSEKRVRSLNIINDQLSKGMEAVSGSTTAAGRAINFLGTAVSKTAGFFSGLIRVVSIAGFAFAALEIVGELIGKLTGINLIAEAFKFVAEKVNNFIDSLRIGRQVSDSFYSSFVKGSDDLKKSISDIKLYNEALINTRATVEKITNTPIKVLGTKQAQKAGVELSQELQRLRLGQAEEQRILEADLANRFPRANKSELGAQFAEGFRGAMDQAPIDQEGARQTEEYFKSLRYGTNEIKKSSEKLEQGAQTRYKNQLIGLAILQKEREFSTEIGKLEKARTKAIGEGNAALAERLKAQIELTGEAKKEVLALYNALKDSGQLTIQQLEEGILSRIKPVAIDIAKQTGLDVIPQITGGLVKFSEDSKSIFANITDPFTKGQIFQSAAQDVTSLSNGLKGTLASSIRVNDAFSRLNDVLEAGSAASQQLEGFISILNQEYKKLIEVSGDTPQAYIQLKPLKDLIGFYETLKNKISAVEITNKALTDTFSAQINIVGSLARLGKIDLGGSIATTSEQERTNQLNFIQQSIERSNTLGGLEFELFNLRRKMEKNRKEGLKVSKQEIDLANQLSKKVENQRTALKALLGFSLDYVKIAEEAVRTESRKLEELKNQGIQILLQNRLQEIQDENADRELTRRFRLEQQRYNLERANVSGDLAVKRIEGQKLVNELLAEANERTKKRLQLERELLEAQIERNKIAIQGREQSALASIESRQGLISKFGLGSPQESNRLELQANIIRLESTLAQTGEDLFAAETKTLEAARLDIKSADNRLEAARKELEAVQKRGDLDVARIAAESSIRKQELTDDKERLADRRRVEEQQLAIAIDNINVQKEARLFELTLTKDRYNQLKIQADIFKDHLNGLANLYAKQESGAIVSAKGITNPSEIKKLEDGLIEKYKSTVGAAMTDISTKVPALINEQEQAIIINTNNQIRGLRDANTRAEALALKEDQNLDKRIAQEESLQSLKTKGAEQDRIQAVAKAQLSVNNAESEQAAATARYKIEEQNQDNQLGRLRNQQKVQEQALADAKELARLSGNGTFLALAESVKTFREKSEELITTILTDVINGTKSIKDVFRQFLLELAKEVQKSIARKVIAEPVGDLIGKVFDPTKWFKPSTPAAVPNTNNPLTVPELSPQSTAIGGYVKQMAIGGYAGLRDRVPALLEPGEFVIRRPAAMAIGGPALNQMNATGQVPATGNVMVNVNNQGTPQTVQGTPRISRQGENLIVDIFVKDIQNNGPIRQTLKGMR